MQAWSEASRSRRTRLAGAALILVIVAGAAWLLFAGARESRQALVAERGRDVMPFDLERTTHIFERLPDGGLQQVLADDPSDATQIALIRTHLQEEAGRFARGDFGDPAAIHGEQMPGLAELRQGYAGVAVAYAELPSGAQLRYTTSDAALRAALHRWFEAQLDDHGDHATDHGGH